MLPPHSTNVLVLCLAFSDTTGVVVLGRLIIVSQRWRYRFHLAFANMGKSGATPTPDHVDRVEKFCLKVYCLGGLPFSWPLGSR